MKQSLLLLLLLSVSLITATHAKVRVVVMSDPHLLTAEHAQAIPINGDGKLDKMSPEIFGKAVETILQSRPEAVLLCGDMSYNGEVSGHTVMAQALAEIEAQGIPVLVIPGNHDIQNPNSIDPERASVTPEQFRDLYRAFGMGDDEDLENVSHDQKTLSWAGSLKGTDLAIIGLDANIYDDSGLYYSDGCIRRSTLDWMSLQAAALRDQGKMVICMVHQELLEHMFSQSILAPSTLLNTTYTRHPADGDTEEPVTLAQLQQAFADAGLQYILTGHFHIHHVQTKVVKNSNGEDFTLTELTTGGLTTFPNWLRHLTFDTEAQTLSLSSSTMIQDKVGEQDLQSVAKAEYAAWANEKSGPLLALGLIQLNSDVDQYEIIDACTQYQSAGTSYPEVLYTRHFQDYDWQPLYLPFDLQYDDWSQWLEMAQLTSASSSGASFALLHEGDVAVKNTPVLIRLKEGMTMGQYTLSSTVKTKGRTLVNPVDGQTLSLSPFSLTGTYLGSARQPIVDQGGYMLEGNQWMAAAELPDSVPGLFLAPQRWYLTSSATDRPETYTLEIIDYDSGLTLPVRDDLARSVKQMIDGQLFITGETGRYLIGGQKAR